jgi:two-component system, response regulator PdtaR
MVTRTACSLLFVEDNRIIATTLGEALRREGYQVTIAASVAEATALLEQQAFSAAILDLLLPDGRGVDVAARLSEKGCRAIVMLTAYSDKELIDEAAVAGSTAYLVKPVTPAQLAVAVEAALATARSLEKLHQDNARLNGALERKQDVSIATGIIMERLHLNRRTAFEALRSEARSQRERLANAAHRLVMASEKLRE